MPHGAIERLPLAARKRWKKRRFLTATAPLPLPLVNKHHIEKLYIAIKRLPLGLPLPLPLPPRRSSINTTLGVLSPVEEF